MSDYGRTPKKYVPAKVIRMLRVGPASLNHRDGFNPRDAKRERVRFELFAEYKVWLETWIVPELERLLPKEKPLP